MSAGFSNMKLFLSQPSINFHYVVYEQIERDNKIVLDEGYHFILRWIRMDIF